MPGKGKGGGGGSGGGGGGDSGVTLNGKKNKADLLIGTPFTDALWGRENNDTLIGEGDGDFAHGGTGNDIVIGDFGEIDEFGNVTITETADDGDDNIFGGDGDDKLYGGGGNDSLQGGLGVDTLDGGGGYDIAYYSADEFGITATANGNGFDIVYSNAASDTERAERIEGIVGSPFDDIITGADIWPGGEVLDDGTGNLFVNTIDGHSGNDHITGGDGADCIHGGADNDSIDGGGEADLLSGGSGEDSILGGDGDDTINGGDDDDTIDGGAGDDLIDGGPDAWWAFADADVIDGGIGEDTISGGRGEDSLTGGADADVFVYHTAEDGGDDITDFSGLSGDGDKIDLTALDLDGGVGLPSLISDGFVFQTGNQLFVDLDGGGPGETDGMGDPIEDDILIVTFTDGGPGFDIDDDILV